MIPVTVGTQKLTKEDIMTHSKKSGKFLVLYTQYGFIRNGVILYVYQKLVSSFFSFYLADLQSTYSKVPNKRGVRTTVYVGGN